MNVAQLIERLSTLPPELLAAVVDADTDWLAPITSCNVVTMYDTNEKVVVINTVGYPQMMRGGFTS